MNEKKIYQQRLLARILLVCGAIIVLTSFWGNRMNKSTLFGILFLIAGALTLYKAQKDEEKLKD